jgi:hypothetical protein
MPVVVTAWWPCARRRDGAAGQGSPTAPVQRGRRREHEDGEGWLPDKKDGGATHQGGRAPMRWRMGWRNGASSRAVALRRASTTTVRSCSMGVSREVRDAN